MGGKRMKPSLSLFVASFVYILHLFSSFVEGYNIDLASVVVSRKRSFITHVVDTAGREALAPTHRLPSAERWLQSSRIWSDLIYCVQNISSPLGSSARVDKPKHVVSPALSSLSEQQDEFFAVEKEPPKLNEFLLNECALDELHEARVASLWENCRRKGFLKRLRADDSSLLLSALRIAYVALWGVKSDRSPEIGINCAAGTARVLGEMSRSREQCLDLVLAALLSNAFIQTTRDGDRTEAENHFIKRFGERSVVLAKCYAALPNAPPGNTIYSPEQVENQIQMLTVLADDWKLLFIRVAERLHTLREVFNLPLTEPHRRRLAEEALFIYATLSHRLNLIKFCNELEDISFRILEPSLYEKIEAVRDSAKDVCKSLSKKVKPILAGDDFLVGQNISFKLDSRVKSAFQLSLKMRRKELVHPELVKDLLGLRVVIHCPRRKQEALHEHVDREIKACYHVGERLKDLSDFFADVDRKDYIQDCKTTGYQSLHYHLIDNSSKYHVEVQVRTKKMNVIAEVGKAAHWFYKDLLFFPMLARSKLYRKTWRSAQQIQENSFEGIFRLAQKQIMESRVLVFCKDKFTVINMKKGATALDAAFAIHSQLGLAAIGAELNGVNILLNTTLSSGDTIVVHSTKSLNSTAQISWLEFVQTPHAVHTLRRHFRQHDRSAVIFIGLLRMFFSIVHDRVAFTQANHTLAFDAQKFVKAIETKFGTSLVRFLEELGLRGSSAPHLLSKAFGVSSMNLEPIGLSQIVEWAMNLSLSLPEEEARDIIMLPLIDAIEEEVPNLHLRSLWALVGT